MTKIDKMIKTINVIRKIKGKHTTDIEIFKDDGGEIGVVFHDKLYEFGDILTEELPWDYSICDIIDGAELVFDAKFNDIRLKNLKGIPQNTTSFILDSLPYFESFEHIPSKRYDSIWISRCPEITTLKGLETIGAFNISLFGLENLKSYDYFPQNVVSSVITGTNIPNLENVSGEFITVKNINVRLDLSYVPQCREIKFMDCYFKNIDGFENSNSKVTMQFFDNGYYKNLQLSYDLSKKGQFELFRDHCEKEGLVR